jgi:RHS repeat-associated protein
VNWVLLDEHFNIARDSAGGYIREGYSGFQQVAEEQIFNTHSLVNAPIHKNGYLYIYLSNQTPNMDVYFDNLQVTHIKGPILEETHYYPFGLTMAGISSRALTTAAENKFKYNGKEEQRKEFSDGSGLEWLDYGARMYDNQIGRFFTQDRFAEVFHEFNPYQYCADNAVKNIDLNGDIFITTTLYSEEKNKNVLSRLDKAIEKGLGGYYKVERDAESGAISLKSTNKKGKMSKEQTAFYNVLTGVINSEKKYEMNIVDGSSKVQTGSWGGIGPGSIDIADIENHPEDGPTTAQGALAHEVYENKLRVDGGKFDTKAYLKAHETSIAKAENHCEWICANRQRAAFK